MGWEWKSDLVGEARCCKYIVNTVVFEWFHFFSESYVFDLSE